MRVAAGALARDPLGLAGSRRDATVERDGGFERDVREASGEVLLEVGDETTRAVLVDADRDIDAGLVTRTVAEGPPLSVTYALTDAGRALLPALAQISLWAEVHLPR